MSTDVSAMSLKSPAGDQMCVMGMLRQLLSVASEQLTLPEQADA
jgi:hypothetical protein